MKNTDKNKISSPAVMGDFIDALSSAVASFRCRMRRVRDAEQCNRICDQTAAEVRELICQKVKAGLADGDAWAPADALMGIATGLMIAEANAGFAASLQAAHDPSKN